MNTRAVANLLGVSQSTVQRWVKQLEMEMDRNEFGHYIYKEEDVELLKEFKNQIQKGTPINEIKIEKKRVGTVKTTAKKETMDDRWEEKFKELERKIESKADSVVSYQLLKHREELEEIKKQLKVMQSKIDKLSKALTEKEKEEQGEEIPIPSKRKRVLHSIFGMKF